MATAARALSALLEQLKGIAPSGSIAFRPASLDQALQASSFTAPPMNSQAGVNAPGNAVDPFGKMPMPLGRGRFSPPHAALPNLVIRGGESFVQAAYLVGYGPVKLSGLRLAGIPLNGDKEETSTSVLHAKDTQLDGVRYECRYGTAGEDEATLYDDLKLGLSGGEPFELKKSDSWISLPLVPAGSKTFTIEGTFPEGLASVSAQGVASNKTVALEFRYRPVKADGTLLDEWQGPYAWGTTAKSKTTFPMTPREVNNGYFGGSFGSRDLKVQVRRTTADDHSPPTKLSKSVITQLRAQISQNPVRFPSGVQVSLVVIEFPSSLVGLEELPEFSLVASSVRPVYSGGNWSSSAETNNPAALARWLLLGPANAKPISGGAVDDAAFGAWFTAEAAAGRSFNSIVRTGRPFKDLLRLVCSIGRASPVFVDGTYTVARDYDKSADTPALLVTPVNTKSFRASKVFFKVPHAVRVTYLDRFQEGKEVQFTVFRSGYNSDGSGGKIAASLFEEMRLEEIDTNDQAKAEALYRLAVARHRPTVYEVDMTEEALVAIRGDLAEVGEDVLGWGSSSGRIKTVASGTALDLDNAVIMETAKTYEILVRKNGGAQVKLAVTLNVGEQLSIVVPSTAGLAAGDLWTFGETGAASVKCVVRSIEPGGDWGAKVTLLDLSPAIFTASGESTAYSGQVKQPPEIPRPTTVKGASNAPASAAPVQTPAFSAGIASSNTQDRILYWR